MLQLKEFTIRHQKDLKTLVYKLNLVVNSGDKVAIVGEEGTGKSSLLKAIVDPDLLASYAQFEGEIIQQFHQIGYLPQGLDKQELAMTVSDFLYQDMAYQQVDFNHFYKLAQQFHLNIEQFETQEQTLSSLSGGEKLKIQLLKLLAQDPDLLLLDEPSSDLDLTSVQWLERFIQQSDKTILFISHDEQLLSRAATCVLHLELLKKRTEPQATFFKGNYQTYVSERQDRFERQLQLAKKEREEHSKRLAKQQRIKQSVEHSLRATKDSTAGRLLAKKMKTVLVQEKKLDQQGQALTEIPQDMDAIHLFFSDIQALPAGKIILSWKQHHLPTGQDIDLEVRGQDKLVFTGPNGIGKTRLLKEIRDTLTAQTSLSVGYMPQDYEEEWAETETPLSFLTAIAPEEKARTLLASLQFTREEISHSVHQLSGGQKAKLFLAKMVLAGNRVLLLDEPTRHFSPTSQPLIRQLLRDYPGTLISVSHDRFFIEEVCDDCYQLNKNKLVKQR